MTEKPDGNKARASGDAQRVVERIRAVAAAGGNSMAQLIIALEALGVGRDEIADVTGKSVRMIQKTAKQIRELECANPSAQRTPVREAECATRTRVRLARARC